MKSFFDVATPEEIQDYLKERICAYDENDEEREPTEAELATCLEEHRKILEDPDINLEELAYLYGNRRDFKAAKACVSKISDAMRMADTGRMLTHFDGYFEDQIN